MKLRYQDFGNGDWRQVMPKRCQLVDIGLTHREVTFMNLERLALEASSEMAKGTSSWYTQFLLITTVTTRRKQWLPVME